MATRSLWWLNFVVVPDIFRISVWNLLCVSHLAPRILRSLLNFWKFCESINKVTSQSHNMDLEYAFCQDGIQSEWAHNKFWYSVCCVPHQPVGPCALCGFRGPVYTAARRCIAVTINIYFLHNYSFVSANVFLFRLLKNLWQHSKKHLVRLERCGLRLAHMMLDVDVSAKLITVLNPFHS